MSLVKLGRAVEQEAGYLLPGLHSINAKRIASTKDGGVSIVFVDHMDQAIWAKQTESVKEIQVLLEALGLPSDPKTFPSLRDFAAAVLPSLQGIQAQVQQKIAQGRPMFTQTGQPMCEIVAAARTGAPSSPSQVILGAHGQPQAYAPPPVQPQPTQQYVPHQFMMQPRQLSQPQPQYIPPRPLGQDGMPY